MQSFAYLKPHSLEEVSALLMEHEGRAALLAGGTELLLQMEHERYQPAVVIDLKGMPELAEISFGAEQGLRLGALVTFAQMAAHPHVRRFYPALAEISQEIGTPAIRNRATLGGNLCHASPAADAAPLLLCFGAVCMLQGPTGARELPLAEFLRGPRQTALQPGEVLIGVHLPPAPDTTAAYQRLTQGQGGHITLAGVAASAAAIGGQQWRWRLAVTALAPAPQRIPAAEAALSGPRPPAALIEQAASLVASACQPIADVRASAHYRQAMAAVLARRAIQAVLARLGGSAR